jgi:putative serine protease PepD
MTVVTADGKSHDATLVGSSPTDDIAVVKINGVSGLTPADLGSSADLQVGESVIAIGNALDLGGEPTVTQGIVSAKDRDLTAEGEQLEGLIQTDAAINPGNSGGPLVNSNGQVVGMNTAIVQDAQNLGFSIAIDRAKPIIEQLKAGKGEITPDQAFLGVSTIDVSSLTGAQQRQFDVKVDKGALVTEVVPQSGADRGGIKVGDVIRKVDDKGISSAPDVRGAIIRHHPGDKVQITVNRGGVDRTLTITLGRRGAGT